MENKQIKISLRTAIILIIIFILILIGLIAIMLKNEKNKETNMENEQQIEKASVSTQKDIEFATEFLKLEDNNKQNMVYSPLSIKYALNLLNDGADGNTRTQIENVIGDLSLTKYNNIENVLSMANAVFIRDTYEKDVKEEYKKRVEKNYNSEVKIDAFKSANNINKWIEKKTFGRINNLIRDEVVQNPDMKMILVNSLAIDMEWKEKFDGKETIRGGKFYKEDGTEIEVAMMTKKTNGDDVAYYKDSNVTSLTMDLKEYNNTQLQFVAIMPNEELSNYISKVSAEDINKVINKSTNASELKNELEISIPRFSTDYEVNLNDDLKKLGINDAFSETTADFSRMTSMTNDNNRLHVDQVLHKTNIDFTENGTKAASTTVIVMLDRAMMMEEKVEKISINKPFLYLIRDKKTGEIWFIGTIYEPTNWENIKEDYQYK